MNIKALLCALLLSFSYSASAEEKEDVSDCRTKVDLNAMRHCMIQLYGYTENTCYLFPTAREQSVCMTDLKRYQSIKDPCRKDLSCYWEKDVKPSVDGSIKRLTALSRRNTSQHSGKKGNPSEISSVIWADPGQGSVIFMLGNQYIIADQHKHRGWIFTPYKLGAR